MINGKQPVIFCDFDGTITKQDNIIAIVRHFQPEGWDRIVEQVIGRQISIREGVGRLFALMPSSRREEIVRFAVDRAEIREGFESLLQYCKQESIEFLVTSGGIDFFVHPLLAPFGLDKERIYCNVADFSGEQIEIVWPHPCDAHCDNDCGMCKVRIIRTYCADKYYRIMIGDSVTDFAGAKLADLVFARSHLIEECENSGIPYVPFETFDEITAYLQRQYR